MSTLSKVFLGLIVLAALPFFYLTAQAVVAYQNWGQKANQYVKDIQRAGEEIGQTRDGSRDGSEPGVRAMRLDLEDVAFRRGRYWLPVGKAAPPAPDGTISVVQLAPPPAGYMAFPVGLEANAVVQAFIWPAPPPNLPPEAPKVPPPGTVRYVGSFRVLEIDANRGVAKLQPTDSRTDAEKARIAENLPWLITEMMPLDDHESFAGLPPEEVRAYFAGPIAEEYLRDGGPATPNDPPHAVKVRLELRTPESETLGPADAEPLPVPSIEVTADTARSMAERGLGTIVNEGTTFQRPLRDYTYLNQELRRRRDEAVAELANAQRRVEQMGTAIADAEKERQYRQTEIQDLQNDVTQLERESSLLKHYAADLEKSLDTTRQEINRLRQQNAQQASAT